MTRTAWKRAFAQATHETKFTDHVEYMYYFAEELLPNPAQVTTSSQRAGNSGRFDFTNVVSP